MGILETINDYVYVAGLFMVGSFSAFAFTSYCIVKKDCKILANKIREERETRKKEIKETENTLRENSYENKYNYESYKNENVTKPILNKYLEKDFDKEFLSRSKKGFVINTSDWIYKNINHVDDVFKNGKIVYQFDKNIINKLSINKSRINGLRLWKLYFLERYFQINNL